MQAPTLLRPEKPRSVFVSTLGAVRRRATPGARTQQVAGPAGRPELEPGAVPAAARRLSSDPAQRFGRERGRVHAVLGPLEAVPVHVRQGRS